MTKILRSAARAALSPVGAAIPADIPMDIRDVVTAVAAALGLKPADLMADFGKIGSLGRRIAAALTVRRALFTTKATAQLFGIAEAIVTDALMTLDAVLAFTQASATHAPLVPLIARVVAGWSRFEAPARRGIPIAEVKETVARVFQVPVADFDSKRRSGGIQPARDVAIYLTRRFTLNSSTVIGRAFGGRHHSTALYVIQKIAPYADAVASKIPSDATIKDWAQALRREMG